MANAVFRGAPFERVEPHQQLHPQIVHASEIRISKAERRRQGRERR